MASLQADGGQKGSDDDTMGSEGEPERRLEHSRPLAASPARGGPAQTSGVDPTFSETTGNLVQARRGDPKLTIFLNLLKELRNGCQKLALWSVAEDSTLKTLSYYQETSACVSYVCKDLSQLVDPLLSSSMFSRRPSYLRFHVDISRLSRLASFVPAGAACVPGMAAANRVERGTKEVA